MGCAGAGRDLQLIWRGHAVVAGDEAQWHLIFFASIGTGADGVLEGSVPATVLERTGGEFTEKRTRSLPGGVSDPAGVGVQPWGSEPRECLWADATAAVSGQ